MCEMKNKDLKMWIIRFLEDTVSIICLKVEIDWH